jgi:hypothetical protein
VQEFNRKAETIAQTIITEMSLPRAQKTYKPKTDMGGIAGHSSSPLPTLPSYFYPPRSSAVMLCSFHLSFAGALAGGEKYMVEGIFFKFAIDLHGIYGGNAYALKVALTAMLLLNADNCQSLP